MWNLQFINIQENCSAGCPCSDYDCLEPTIAPESTTATVPSTITTSTTNTSPTTTAPQSTTAKLPMGNAVLVLSTHYSGNQPMVIDFDGKYQIYLNFHRKFTFSGNINDVSGTFVYGENTDTYYGCAATLKNEFWYFGGSGNTMKRQVI